MLDRIGSMGVVVGLERYGGVDIKENTKKLRGRWNQLEQFLAYEFRAIHIKTTHTCKAHCCHYALNSVNGLQTDNLCPHTHTGLICPSCDKGNTLFNDLELLLIHVKTQLSEDWQKDEIKTMLTAVTEIFRTTVTAYLAHQVRAYAQFSKIKEEENEYTDTRCGLQFDHKQKILPTKFREGQVEYFGKRGMSILGFMLTKRVVRLFKGVQTEGLEYHFYDVVVDKYSSQDDLQVLSILDKIIDQIKKDHPAIKELVLGSDNASCLASHDNIPFIHHRKRNGHWFWNSWHFSCTL